MKKIIATDLDGTLFYPKRRVRMISSRNKAFIRQYIDEGGKVIIVSGRNYFFSHKVVSVIDRPVDVLSCNSAYISCDGKIIRELFLPAERMSQILEEINRDYDPHGYLIMSKNQNLVTYDRYKSKLKNLANRFYYMIQGAYREPYVNSQEVFYDELSKGQVYKLMIYFGLSKKAQKIAKEVNKELREKYPEIEASWIGMFIEITPRGCTKADGIKFYLDYLKRSYQDVVVVGDSGNDISMFTAFEHSFCMEHAHKSVQKYAKHCIRHFSDLEQYVREE
ncbi:MAG TPA: HAD family hydrolase [Bacilli bacterium]|nr:HAD family hydrolase [Bacilli bacterium]HQC32225.1 HAD family hydrolase [Bacilli bacterium]